MKILVGAVALLAIGVAAPTFSDSAHAQGTYTTNDGKKAVKKKAHSQVRVVRRGSPYSTNPEHDVYVNGQYVGSDPDPRVRWSIKREYCQDSLDGC